MNEQFRAWPPDDETLRCPFAYFRAANDRSPVLRFGEDLPTGAALFLVTGHAEASFVLSHPLEFTADLAGVLPGFDKSALPPPFPELPKLHEPQVVFFASGEDHKIKRQLAMALVKHARLSACRAPIRAAVRDLLQTFLAEGACDFQTQFSDILTIRMLKIVLALPDEAEAVIKRVSRAIAASDVDPNITAAQVSERDQAFHDLFALNRKLLEERTLTPGDDFISELIQLQVAIDGQLDVNTLSVLLFAIMFGGDHAVGAHLTHLAIALAQDQALQRRLRADRSRVPTFIYEVLRLEAPVPWLFRHCVRATDVGGVTIPAGSAVIVATSAASRDPARFADPDTLSVDRANSARDHLSMGRGAHRCVGEPLAQILAEAVVEGMLDMMREIRLDPQISVIRARVSHQFRCPVRVRLLFEVAA